MRADRPLVRLGIPALLLAACAGAIAVACLTSPADVPSFAFHSPIVLAVQLALLFFYAALLLLVPTIRALVDGDLPIELSLRGARWREEALVSSDEFLARLTGAEDEARQANFATREEVRHLKVELGDAETELDAIADRLRDWLVEVETKLMKNERQD
jgi:hypothetical protein